MIKLLVKKTKRYVNKDKSKSDFTVAEEEMMIFEWYFLCGYNISLALRDH